MSKQGMFRRCPKSGRIIGPNYHYWPKWAFILTGFLAVAWYLIRVVPKPSRAMYPCQQAASPFRIGFLVYLLSLAGTILAFRKSRWFFQNSKYVYGLMFLGISLVSLFVFIGSNTQTSIAATANNALGNILVSAAAPTGTAKGIFPGRVAWVYNINAAKWTGSGNYWASSVNPQAEYDKSFTAGIASLSGGTNDSTSWAKIFKWFNDNHGRAGTGYQPGDKIAIKLNQNNTAYSGADHGNGINASPQSALACVRSLVNAGVPQADIWIGDPSRAVTDNIFNAIHSAYPSVQVVDYYGNNGRVTTGVVQGAFPNSSGFPNAQSACFNAARYIINMPLMKGHTDPMVTFGAKNFYGICGIKSPYNLNTPHPNVNADGLSKFMTNPNFGGKVVLWVMDAMYPTYDLDGTPKLEWKEDPFLGKPTSSFIMSLDGVAEESVSFDFFVGHYGGGWSDEYIIKAATLGGGVAEHWNNKTDRKYSRNLGTGNGIELVKVDPAVAPVAISMGKRPIPKPTGKSYDLKGRESVD